MSSSVRREELGHKRSGERGSSRRVSQGSFASLSQDVRAHALPLFGRPATGSVGDRACRTPSSRVASRRRAANARLPPFAECVDCARRRCGIFACFGVTGDQSANRKAVLKLVKRIVHRGPDWSSVWGDGHGNYIGHQRLSIVSPDLGNSTVEGSSGNQPLFTKDKTICWIVNGEIYNHTALKVGETPTRLSGKLVSGGC